MPKIPPTEQPETPQLAPWLSKGSLARRLSTADLANLRESGLTEETIEASCIYTETNTATLSALLNRRCGNLTGMVFPHFAIDGKPSGFVRVRPHNRNGGPKYLQPTGTPLTLYFPPLKHSLHKLRDGKLSIFITEGEKKSLLLAQEGLAAISLAGVNAWNEPTTHNLRPELVATVCDRDVFICFDSDARDTTRRMVDLQRRRLAMALRGSGAKECYDMSPPLGSGGAKQGIDDWLVAGGSLDALVLEARCKVVPNVERRAGRYGYSEMESVLCARLGRPDEKRIWACRVCGGQIRLREPDVRGKVRCAGCTGCKRFRGDAQDFRATWAALQKDGLV